MPCIEDLERRMSNKEVASTYYVPKNTLSNWTRNKGKALGALNKGININQQKLKRVIMMNNFFKFLPKHGKSKCSYIFFHDLRKESYLCQRIGC